LAEIKPESEFVMRANSEKDIYDLCAGTGEWSRPYREAGYNVILVTLPSGDVRLVECPNRRPWGVLAAPVCTHFSGSGAQYWPQKDIDGRTLAALAISDACCRFVLASNPEGFWALENPVGRLRKWLGPPVMIFNPCDYGEYGKYKCSCGCEFDYSLGKYGCPNCLGENIAILSDAYTKRTCLWGNFNRPKQRPVQPVRVCKQGSWVQKLGGSSERTKTLRSVTPQGFAKAFFEANP
jgi:hypothetical protein